MTPRVSIVQQLRRLQHEEGYLNKSPLRALAQSIDVPLHRIQEVASCFPQFRLQEDGGAHAPRIILQVCRDMACHLRGAANLIEGLRQSVQREPSAGIQVEGVSCLGRCDRAPVVRVDHRNYTERTLHEIQALVRECIGAERPTPDLDVPWSESRAQPWQVDIYANRPIARRYTAVQEFLSEFPEHADLPTDEQGYRLAEIPLLEKLKVADLLGMGGAGAPAHKKWSDVLRADGGRGDDHAKYIVCNADESEPGTFKDRELLLRTPHLVLEGVILAGLLTNATRGYIYMRHEYEEQIDAMANAIRRAEELRVCGQRILGTSRTFPVEIFVSPGGYICGEQTALLEAMEDRRAEPRNRPPELSTNGLYDKPTLVSNVETFAWVPLIALAGGEAYRDGGRWPSQGMRLFSMSGDVARPGVYEVPVGIPLGELIDEHAGGMRGRRPFMALAPSGPSGGFLPANVPIEEPWAARLRRRVETAKVSDAPSRVLAEFVKKHLAHGATHLRLWDVPLDLLLFRELGWMLGAGMVVYAEGTDLLSQAINALEFFRNESCGKCVPCREGCHHLVELAGSMRGRAHTATELAALAPRLDTLAETMQLASICGLGNVAPNPLVSLLRYFDANMGARENGDAPPAV